MPAEIEAELIRVLELPGAAVFPESVGIDPATGDAYVGSLADGSLYRLAPGGTSDQKAETWSSAWDGGRTSVAGVKVDDAGRLLVRTDTTGDPIAVAAGDVTHLQNISR